MNEKNFLKYVLDENLANKEHLRQRAINSANVDSQNIDEKGVSAMKRRFLIPAICLCIVILMSVGVYAADAIEYARADSFLDEIGINADSLSRSEVKKVYRDIKSETFAYDTTRAVLYDRAVELGIKDSATSADSLDDYNAKDIYELIINYNPYTYTGKVTSEQVLKIKADMKYSEIIKLLGSTKDIGSGRHVLQYVVDDSKILYLSFANENEVCGKSGEELLKELVNVDNEGDSDNTFNCTLTSRDGNWLLVSCPTYKNFDTAYVIVTDNTEIVFEDGGKATIDDVKGGLIVTITGEIRDSYPCQTTAVKVVIKK